MDIGHVAGGVVNHGHFTCKELCGQVGPLYDSLCHAFILILEIQPELKRLHILRCIEIYTLAVFAHQVLSVGAVL